MEAPLEPQGPSELDKLRGGLPHRATDPGLIVVRQRARRLAREYNATPEDQMTARTRLLASLFGALGEGADVEAPLFCEYGQHVFAGSQLTVGPNCVLLDVGRITLGDRVRLGPGVHLYAVAHPFDAAQRAQGLAQAAPITVGDDVWIGGGAVVGPTVTIGAGTVVAAGSVVLEALPPGVLAAGNPCRVVREL